MGLAGQTRVRCTFVSKLQYIPLYVVAGRYSMFSDFEEQNKT